jgi:sigma-B regulation protein RsbU (phosphoserine phosphatase)
MFPCEHKAQRGGYSSCWRCGVDSVAEQLERAASAPESGTTSVLERMRVAALHEVHLVDTPPEERFDRITRLAKLIFGVPIAQINLLGEYESFTKSPQPAGETTHRPVDETFCSITIQTPGMLVIPNTTHDARFASRAPVTGEQHIRFYAGRPLSLGDDLRIGTLCIVDTEPRELSAVELNVLDEMGLWVERELRDSRDPEGEAGADASGASIPNPPTDSLPPTDALPTTTSTITMPAGLADAPLMSPTSLAVATPTYSIAGTSVPMRKIGSDFFAWREVDGVVEMTVADVMGKGAVAAAIASTVRDTLQVHAGVDVGETLANANADLARDLRLAGIFATLFHARIEVDTGIVEYADAGHGLTLIVRAGGAVERLESSGFPLGLMARGNWAVRSTILQEGDMMVSFTDGVLALFDGTIASLDDVVALVRSSSDTRDVVDRVVALNKRQRGGDDVTIIALSRTE